MHVDLLELATKSYQRRQGKFSMKRHDVQLLTSLAYRTLQEEGGKFDALTDLRRF